MAMAPSDPAELLLVRDQYEQALRFLSRGLTAEEAGAGAQALDCYRTGRRHLTQGAEVPTGHPRHQGASWDTARGLQRHMTDTLATLDVHLSQLDAGRATTVEQRRRLIADLNRPPPPLPPPLPPPPLYLQLYPSLPPSAPPLPLPSLPPLPPRPASPAARRSRAASPAAAVAPGAAAMASSSPGDHPPAYTPGPGRGHRSLAYGPAGTGLWSAAAASRDGHELLWVPSGVQMFFVAPGGQVSALSNPGFLRIIKFDSESKEDSAAPPSSCLHVCDWLYPLTVETPVLLANSGIFMFPDSVADTPGSFVGLVLSSQLPASYRDTLVDLLSQLADLRIQGPEGASEVINLSTKVPLGPAAAVVAAAEPAATGAEKDKRPLPGWSEKMAQGILSGASKFSEGCIKGAEATGRAIHKGAAKIRDHMTPEDTPSEVSPRVTRGLQAAKQATGGAVRVSKFLVNGVSAVAGHVADKVAPHVKKHGAKLVPESLKKSKEGQPSNVDGAKLVAASSVQGFSTVWSSLESGAKMVGKSVASETVTTVTYKYGSDAGDATDTALRSVVNVGVTAYNIDNLGIKAFLKTAGKKTAKAMVKSSDKGAGPEGAGPEEAEKMEE